jgi:hypothetical protein
MSDPLSETQDLQAISEPGRERIVQQAIAGRHKRKKLLPRDTPANIAPSKVAAACGAALLKRSGMEDIPPEQGVSPFGTGWSPAMGQRVLPNPAYSGVGPGWSPAMGQQKPPTGFWGGLWHALMHPSVPPPGWRSEAPPMGQRVLPNPAYSGVGNVGTRIGALNAHMGLASKLGTKSGAAMIGAPAAAGPTSVAKVMHNASYGASAGGFTPSVRTDSGNGHIDKKAAYPALAKAAMDERDAALLGTLIGPAAIGSVVGGLRAPAGHHLKGMGRGAVAGLGYTAGSNLGGLAGMGLGATPVPAALGAIGGGIGGVQLARHMMGPAPWVAEEAKKKQMLAEMLAKYQGAGGPPSEPEHHAEHHKTEHEKKSQALAYPSLCAYARAVARA